MTTKKVDAIQEVLDAAFSIKDNARILSDMQRNGWATRNRDRSGKALMELRHDLEDAIKHVRMLEAEDEG